MKAERVFTIASIITFFALLPALIILQVRVFSLFGELAYLLIIIDLLLIGFMGLEIFLFIRKWRKDEREKKEKDTEKRMDEKIKISQEWEEKEKTTVTKEENNED